MNLIQQIQTLQEQNDKNTHKANLTV